MCSRDLGQVNEPLQQHVSVSISVAKIQRFQLGGRVLKLWNLRLRASVLSQRRIRINGPSRVALTHRLTRRWRRKRQKLCQVREHTGGGRERRERRQKEEKKKAPQRLDATQAQGVRGGDKGREVNPGKAAQRPRCWRGRKDGGGNGDSERDVPFQDVFSRTQVLPVALVQNNPPPPPPPRGRSSASQLKAR